VSAPCIASGFSGTCITIGSAVSRCSGSYARGKRRSSLTAAAASHPLPGAPVLSDVIGRANPAYLQRIDRVNVVGYGRPWRETGTVDHTVRVDMLCV